MAALNVVYAGREYWELWHGDGFSGQTSSEIARVWREATNFGYDGYKKKPFSEEKYRQQQ